MTEHKKLWLWLTTMEGMTYAKTYHLIQKFHRPEHVYEASPSEYEGVRLIDKDLIERLQSKDMARVDRLIDECARKDIRILTVDEANYPQRLRYIDAQPYVLYLLGRDVELDTSLTVGMIGARKSTPYGIECAQKLSAELTKAGALVVSGMAEGIDGASNLAALKAGGETVAILGCGLDVVYPRIHKELMLHIKKRGLLISEYPPGAAPLRYHFPERNRILSGLCEAIVIVEARNKSGTRITGDLALSQGKDVFVVPGSIFSPNSEGTLAFLKEGARPVTCAEDIISEYRWKYKLVDLAREEQASEKIEDKNQSIVHIIETDEKYKDLSEQDKTILKALSCEPEDFDKICVRTQMKVHEVNGRLAILTVQGFVQEHPFGRFSLLS